MNQWANAHMVLNVYKSNREYMLKLCGSKEQTGAENKTAILSIILLYVRTLKCEQEALTKTR